MPLKLDAFDLSHGEGGIPIRLLENVRTGDTERNAADACSLVYRKEAGDEPPRLPQSKRRLGLPRSEQAACAVDKKAAWQLPTQNWPFIFPSVSGKDRHSMNFTQSLRDPLRTV